MKRKLGLILLALVFYFIGNGQVIIDKSIHFTNENDTLSQIKEIGTVTDSTNLLSFGQSVHEKIISIKLQGNGYFNFTSPYNGFELKKGMQFHFLFDSINNAIPSIICGNDTIELQLPDGNLLNNDYLKNNTIFRVVFNGTEFQIVQYIRNSCPQGFVSVNDNFCIEINERPVLNYSSALSTCEAIGASLCKWSEWYYACINLNGISVSGMNNNWEFIGDSSNHSNTVNIVGHPSDGGCLGFYSENLDVFNRNFRCCYKK